MFYWPRHIPARAIDWRPDTPSTPAGSTLDGLVQMIFQTGGPLWRLSLTDLVMRGRLAILDGLAAQDLMVGGRAILVRPCDCRLAPLAVGSSFGSTPASAGAPFDDIQDFEAAPIVATISACDLRAVSGTITVTAGARALIAGDQFSVTGPVWGQRMHRLTSVTPAGGGVYAVRYLPPLREATAAGDSLDFNRPGVWMKGAMRIDKTIPGRLHTGEARFVELERPPTELELA